MLNYGAIPSLNHAFFKLDDKIFPVEVGGLITKEFFHKEREFVIYNFPRKTLLYAVDSHVHRRFGANVASKIQVAAMTVAYRYDGVFARWFEKRGGRILAWFIFIDMTCSHA
jgi:hypothetical protein